MAINQSPMKNTVNAFYFEAFGKNYVVYTTKSDQVEVLKEIKDVTRCDTAHIRSHEELEVSAEEYTAHSFYQLKKKAWQK